MGLTINWTELASTKLQEIFEYYFESAGFEIAEKLTNGIIDETLRLPANPRIGQKEPLLKDHPKDFRYLVFKQYKIIYWIDEMKNTIDIANIFDCRQDPKLLMSLK